MTQAKRFKRAVRERMLRTGEPYTTARAAPLAEAAVLVKRLNTTGVIR